MSDFIIINGNRYNRIFDVYCQKSFSSGVEYSHSLCIKNSYWVGTSTDTFFHNGTSQSFNLIMLADSEINNNILFYDFETSVVVDSTESASRFSWMNTQLGITTYWQNSSLLSIDNFKTIGANYILNSQQNFSMINYTNSTYFNYMNYSNLELNEVFNSLHYRNYSQYTGVRPFGLYAELSFSFQSNNMQLYDTNDDLKIGFSMWLEKQMEQGYIEGVTNNAIFAVDWTVYIDGTYNPTITITWKSDYLNFDETGNTIDATTCFIGVGSESPINVKWASNTYTTSFQEIIKILYPSWYEKVISGIGSLLDAPTVSMRMLGATMNNELQVNGGTVYFVMNAKGEVSESGLSSESVGMLDTITIIHDNYTGGGSDEDSETPSENDSPSEGGELGVKGFNLLTLTYALTPTRLNQLGSFIWGASFLTNLKLVNNNPIENIVSCKMFPFTVTGNADTSIKLGNVSTGVMGNPVSSGGYTAKRTISGFTIAPLFNNFFDYEPYTKISIFLPFIGIKELQPSQIMNKTLSLEYITDIVTGVCKCIVKSGGKQIADYDGSVGIDIPITSSNRAQVELSYITSALGVVGSVAMGSPLGVVGSVLSGASSSYHSETKGTSSPTTGVYGALTPFVIFDRPKYTLPYAYGKTKGFVCNKTLSIGSLNGFTVCHENVNLSGISCTNEELEEIKGLLTSGFFA